MLTGQRDTLAVPAAGFETATLIIREADFIPTLDDYFYYRVAKAIL